MIDLLELQRALEEMTPRQNIFHLIKKELLRRGYWKNKDRGAKPPQKRLDG
jgi:hypothetical protein